MRAKVIFKSRFRRTLRSEAGGKAIRIHHFDRRRPDEVDLRSVQRFDIGLEVARVTRKILIWRKLCWIDENRYHHAFGAPLRFTHELHVAAMQRSHGRHQSDSLAGLAIKFQRAAKRMKRAYDFESDFHIFRVVGELSREAG